MKKILVVDDAPDWINTHTFALKYHFGKKVKIDSANNWLGLYSTKDKIISSGLWQVNKLEFEQLYKNDLYYIKKFALNNLKVLNNLRLMLFTVFFPIIFLTIPLQLNSL